MDVPLWNPDEADHAMVGRYIGSKMEEGEIFRFAVIGEVQGVPERGRAIFGRHYDPSDTPGYSVCLRGPNDPPDVCPKCKAGVTKQMRCNLAVYGLDTHEQHVLEMSYAWFREQRDGVFSLKPPDRSAYILKATGAKKTTDRRYPVTYDDKLTPEQVEEVKALTPFGPRELVGGQGGDNTPTMPGDEPVHGDDDVPF